jgi:peptide/nickel transport system substrate-binding protein
LSGIVIKVIPEDGVRAMALETGQVDWVTQLPPPEVERLLKSQPTGVVIEVHRDFPEVHHVVLRQRGALKDVRVRRALAYAVDYETIANNLYRGLAEPAGGTISHVMHGFSVNMPYCYDPEKAKRLLAEAGYGPGELNLTMGILSYDWSHVTLAQALKDQFARVGVNLKIEEYAELSPWIGPLFDGLDKGYDMYVWWLRASIPDAYAELRGIFHSSAQPPIGYSNPEVDRLLAQAERTVDRKERAELYRQIEEKIISDVPVLFGAHTFWTTLMRDVVKGYRWDPYQPGSAPDWYSIYLAESR